jgi:hypothetical protein
MKVVIVHHKTLEGFIKGLEIFEILVYGSNCPYCSNTAGASKKLPYLQD